MAPRPDRAGALALKANLAAEIAWLPGIVDFVERARRRLASSREPEFDALPVAHGIADLYTLAEKLFLRIAKVFEGVPAGADWHAELLRSMALDMPPERPPVLRPETARALGRLRDFRHLLRNANGIRIDAARCLALAGDVPAAAVALREDRDRFVGFLDVLASA